MSEQSEKVVKVFKFAPEGFSDEYFEKALKIKLELARKIAGSTRNDQIIADIFHEAKKDIETAWKIQRLLDKIQELDEVNAIYRIEGNNSHKHHSGNMMSALRVLFHIKCVKQICDEYGIEISKSVPSQMAAALFDIQLPVKYLVV